MKKFRKIVKIFEKKVKSELRKIRNIFKKSSRVEATYLSPSGKETTS